MQTMTSSSHRDRPTASPAPGAAETTRFPSAAAYAAALEASAERRARGDEGTADAAALRELRLLLEENLSALRAVYEEQRRTIASALRHVETARDELGALSQADAPWVAALDQTRALIRAAFAEMAAGKPQQR